jgi:hypothetical protein
MRCMMEWKGMEKHMKEKNGKMTGGAVTRYMCRDTRGLQKLNCNKQDF